MAESPSQAISEQRDNRRPEDRATLDLLPIEPTSGRPLPPKVQPGYYPGFSTLAQQKFWDEATREVVLARVRDIPPIRFFTPEEATLMHAILARVMPQDDRDDEHKIPILPAIDQRLHSGRIEGYRYEDMPPDGEAHRLGLHAIDAGARQKYGKSFVDLGPREQDEILKAIQTAKPVGAEEIWRRLPVKRYWAMLMQDAADVYYAHPYAWDEIGFGGPAYPRGYMRQEAGQPEPWEVEEQRYSWAPPPSAGSIRDTTDGWSPSHPGEERAATSEGGTH
jgi:hypothetical protein